MIDWTIPYTLTSPQGTLLFNQATGSPYTSNANYLFLLDDEKCSETPGPLRISQDNIPQFDGWIIHPSFLQGMQLKLDVSFWIEGGGVDNRIPACDADLCVMWDTLLLHIKALTNPTILDLVGGDCRIGYTPACAAARMIDRIQVIEWPTVTKATPLTSAAFTLASTFPYEIDQAEDTPNLIDDGDTEVLVNNGNTDMYPVYRAHGPFTAFEILNQTTGLYIAYDGAFPPGSMSVASGHYIEIDTFRNTVYLDGSSANRLAAINMLVSDFFPLVPGSNSIEFASNSGSATLDVLWQSAWVN